MADGLTITIDGTDYRIPDDLDLNDVVALEAEGYSLDNLGGLTALRFLVHRLLIRTHPDITLEEAGAKVPLSMFTDKVEEGPPPIPLPEPEAQNGTRSDDGKGNGSTDTSAKVTHVHAGLR
jgi:hypothetical protein